MIIAIESALPFAIENLLDFVSYIAEDFLKDGYKIRGGITKGELYIDDIIVWGSGLVDAYRLESERAIYPRILVDESLLDDVREDTKSLMIPQSDDGLYYLDYLKGYGRSSLQHLETINKAMPFIEEELLQPENRQDEKVLRNLRWLESYLRHNKAYFEDKLLHQKQSQ